MSILQQIRILYYCLSQLKQQIQMIRPIRNSQVATTKITQSTMAVYPQTQQQENRECWICADLAVSQYTRKIFTCEHNQLCLDCQNLHVVSCLDQGNFPKCIAQGCPGTIKHEDQVAMNMLKASIRDRLFSSINKKQLKNNKKCPTPDCPGFINRGTCNLCLTIYCQQCYLPQHVGICSKQIDLTLPPGIVRCPNCGQGIQRDGGCLHMTCNRPLCRYEFCFKCLDKWSIRHHACEGGLGIIDALMNWFNQRFS